MIIKNNCSRKGGSTYIFKALNALVERKSHLREYIKTLELKPGDRPWLDLRDDQILQRKWPPNADDEELVLDKGARVLQADEPEFAEYKLFRETRRQRRDVDANLDNLHTMWPAFETALIGYSSEQEVADVFDNPDSGMILLVLSSPNLEKLVIHDETGQFTAAFNGIFRAMGKVPVSAKSRGAQPTKSQLGISSTTSLYLRNLKTLKITHPRVGYFPLQLVVPVLSFVRLQVLILEVVNDMWTHSEFPCCSFTDFEWLTPDPLMTVSKLAIHRLDTPQSNLRSFLSKAKNMKSLWLGFGSWTYFGSCAADQVQLIKTISDTVGSDLNDLMLTHRYGRDDRDIVKLEVLDFRAFTKLTRLGLHARFWEDEEVEGFPLEFSVDEDGGYNFLPPTLKSLYLFKPGLLRDSSCEKILKAVYQTKSKAAALEDVIFVTQKNELSPAVAKVVAKLAAVGVTVSAWPINVCSKEESDVHEDYLEFFRGKDRMAYG
jgi:hypothetical protein